VQDRKSRIRDALVDAQAQLLDALDRVGPDDWPRTSPNEGWTVRDLLTHLATSEVGFVGTIKNMASGQGGVPGDFDPNRWNAGQLRRQADAEPSQLMQRLEAAHGEMLSLLESLDDTALDRRGNLSVGGEGSTEDNFLLVASHKREHTGDIRAAVQQVPA
jgi:uncharacterized protein (TIGR03083 family)